jgi:glutaredoxin
MKHKYLVGAALLLLSGVAVAQVYKWVDAKGVTHFSDQPPPEQKNVQVKPISSGGSAAADLPYEVAQAARNAPVTFYTTPNCAACDQARALLQSRGIPYSERSVTTPDDIERLKAAGGDNSLPFLTVGRQRKLNGFEAGAWNAALSAAQYPEKRMLPPSFQFAKAEPAAPPPAPVAPAPAPAAAAVPVAPKVPPKPDFQF